MQKFFLFTYEIKAELLSHIISSMAYIFLNYFIMLINHFHNYLLIFQNNNQDVTKMLSFIKQIDFSTSFFENIPFLNVEVLVFFSILIAFILMFLIILQRKIVTKNHQLQASTLGNTFIRSIRLTYWVLCYPFLLASIFTLFQPNALYSAFCFMTAIFVLIITGFHDTFLLNDQYQNKDFLNIMNSRPFIISNWIKIAQCFFSSYYYYKQDYEILYIVVSLSLATLNYLQILYFLITFGNYDVDYFFQLINCTYFGLSVGGLIQYTSNMKDPYSLLILLIILMFLSIHLSIRDQLIQYKFSNPTNVSLRLQLLTWFRELKNSNVYYHGTIINHYNHPNNKKCFLRHSAVFYSGKKISQYKYLTTKKHNLFKHRGLFVKFLKKCIIETELRLEPQHPENRLIYAEILFYQFNLIQESYRQALKITKQLTLNQYLRIFQLKLLINKKLKEFNSISFKSKLPFENMLFCEEQMKEFSKSFLKILELQIFYWKSQMHSYIAIDEQISINNKILQEIQQCQQNWRNVIVHISEEDSFQLMRFRWRFLYYFFKLYVLHKKLKASEMKELPDYNLKSSQILQDEKVDERSSSDDEAANKMYYLTNSIIADKTMFFRVDKDGEIIQASNSVLKVLGQSSQQYRGERVESLMPTIIKINHKSFLKQFYRTGQSENLYKRRSIQIKHSKGYCLKVQKYLKYIFNLQYSRFEYMSMMRPVSSRSQYMVLNSLWEIDSVSEYLYSLIGDYKFQFLSLCPKAISYSDYNVLLTSYDMKILSLKLCSFGSRERIQDKKFTFKRSKDVTFSNKNINDSTSLVFKRELEDKQKNNVLQLFQQVLDEDNEIDQNTKMTKLTHIKFNIRVPQYKDEMMQDYNRYENEVKNQFFSGEAIRRVVCRNDQGKLRVDKDEFLNRYRWVKQYRMKFRYTKIKNLFEVYCQEKLLDKVLKVDANLKFYKSLNNISFLIIKVNRLEIYDEHTFNERSDDELQNLHTNNMGFTTGLQEVPIAQNITAQTTQKNQSGFQYSDFDVNSNREQISRPFLADNALREDFQLLGQDNIFSLSEQNNVFIKEESNKLHKSNHKLNALLFTNRISFFTQFLITTLTFFLCQFYYNPKTLHSSVTLFSNLYNFTMISIETYNYLIDIVLMNEGKLTDLLLSNQMTKFNTTEQFFEFITNEITVIQTYMYNIYYDPDFVQLVYSGFYNQDSSLSGIDILDLYQVDQTVLFSADRTQIFFNSTILNSIRSYMIPYFEQLLQDSIDQLVNQGMEFQNQSHQNLIIFITIQASLLILAIITTILLKFRFRYDVNIIYSLIARIPQEDKIKAINQQQILFFQLSNLIEEEEMGIKIRKAAKYAKNDAIIQQDSDEKNFDKQNKKREKKIIKKLPKITVAYLIVFLIYSMLLIILYSVVYYFLINNQTSTKDFFTKNSYIQQTTYFWIITILKEQYIHENYLNTTFFPELVQLRLQQFLDDINKIYPALYQTNINEIEESFDNSICEQNIDETGTYIYYNQYCSLILNGAMSRGLKQFNQILQGRATKTINPDDERYGTLDIDELSEYQVAFQIIYLVFLNNKAVWEVKANDILQQTLQFCLICFLLQVIFTAIIYSIFIELYLHKKLKKDFYFSKQYYKQFMLNRTINQEKTIRVDLVKAGLLSK